MLKSTIGAGNFSASLFKLDGFDVFSKTGALGFPEVLLSKTTSKTTTKDDNDDEASDNKTAAKSC